MLVVGPHEPYLAYVSDVLPSLGEEGVQTATLRDLVPEGATAGTETDADVARVKASLDVVAVIEAAVRFYEDPPTTGMTVETDAGDIRLRADAWAEAFEPPDPGTPHNEARDQVWEELLTILVDEHDGDEHDGDEPADEVRASLQRNRELRGAFTRAWPLLEPADVVADLWSVPAYLRRCAPGLTREEIRALQRDDARAWTVPDLPLLDAARQRLGDPEASRLRQRQRQRAVVAGERARMAGVIDELIAADDSELLLMTSLRHGGAGQGAGVRPGRPRRPAAVRGGHRGRGRPLRRDDPGDPAARGPHELRRRVRRARGGQALDGSP
ncbi:hypothetical protein [Blastococcus sp. VKM Ac-2987]|uniref:hypothetical protein n=1 Tax=Blastococcus sp. VKM Ac-2987 TaxID=3004141 RepID=UPI0022AB7FE9|nr:hypothetical protein [Blastococcus sp. VKM Ac-2987]MCZ2859204.1 hypothetical protein [Blastococcus sp. VKM Ac-2987]